MNSPETSSSQSAEETVIVSLLGLMTILTFANVIARYVFNTGMLWAVEVTVFLFAWLILLGAPYAVKTRAHLGVDAAIQVLGPPHRRLLALFSVACCLLYSVFLLKGAWDYWANFANLPATTGRWFPTGFETSFREKGWYETQDTPMPALFGWGPLDWLQHVFNQGEPYEKIPRLLPYFVLPVSMSLLLYRYVQTARMIYSGQSDRVIVSHEAGEAVSTPITDSGGPERSANPGEAL